MKKRNKYYQKEKDFLKIEKSLAINNKAQRDLGYIELDEPIPHGYDAYLVLRKDISNRDDAWVFEYILDIALSKHWWRKDYTNILNRRGKDRLYIYQNTRMPHIRDISEKKYESLPVQVRKWFNPIKHMYFHCATYYECTVPNFYYEIEVKRHYKTHIRILDELLLQEEAELEKDYYSSYFRNIRKIENGAPKSYVKLFNRSFRAKTKNITNYNSKNDINDWKEYPCSGRHTARWSYW